jgi:two-component system, OmpR family, alkaline phosphatase synthesis response regulator PhoP
MSRILIIEDNADLAFGLQKTLEFEGYEVEVAEDGPTGLERARSGSAELIVLDLMLPGMDGFRILRTLRGLGSTVPVLVLTARGDETDVVMGFDSGADDYVTKPFSTLELLARVRALLRRGGPEAGTPPRPARRETFGDVEVDTSTRTVRRAGTPVPLTPKAFDLLLALLRRNGEIATREQLLEEVWRYRNARVKTRTVDLHMAELRRKLEDDPANPRHLLTVRKAGYRVER